MAYTAKRLAGPTQPNSSSESTVYTPSTGVRAVVKEVWLANNSTNAGTIKAGIGGVNSSQIVIPETYIVAKSTSAAADSLTVLALSLVLASTADTFVFQNGSSSGLITVTVNGEENT